MSDDPTIEDVLKQLKEIDEILDRLLALVEVPSDDRDPVHDDLGPLIGDPLNVIRLRTGTFAYDGPNTVRWRPRPPLIG